MLIRKGNITREIDERRLAEFNEKGFERINTEKKKSLYQMNAEELDTYAEELGAPPVDGMKVAEKREAIREFLERQKE